LLVACVALSAPRVDAQSAYGLTAGVTRPLAKSTELRDSVAVGSAIGLPGWFRLSRLPRATAPLASLIVPGAGQAMLGQDRSLSYVAVEGLMWWLYVKESRERSQQEAAFRDIARRVARAHLSPNGPDGDWVYYEAMRDWTESGVFSRSATQLLPEENDSTFNGHQWTIAKALSADSVSALEIYKQRAVRANMAWSWRNAGLQKDEFAQATNKRNDADKAARAQLTYIVLNHLLSMVDAFATFRLQVRPDENGRTALGASVSW
jgi:hypothetical protein